MLYELHYFNCYICLATIPATHYSHCFIELSQPKPVYWLFFYYTVFHMHQAFRFMVGPGHCPMISKYDPLLSKAEGAVDPSFFVVKKSHFNKKYSSTNSTKQKEHVGFQYSKTWFKQPLKKWQNNWDNVRPSRSQHHRVMTWHQVR